MIENTLTPSRDDERELKQSLAPLCAQSQNRLIVLFGSMSKGATTSRSDLDLAILADEPLDLVDVTNRVTTMIHVSDVDVVDLRRASPLLAMEVARHGRLLYERAPGEYAEFCSLAQRRYADTAKLRAGKKVAIAQFLKARGVL